MQVLNILVVDDDPVTRALMCKRLSKDEYRVETAQSGVDAVRMICENHYDVVLTDLKMPGNIDGIGVLESAKEHNIKTEVILITAHGTIDNAIVGWPSSATFLSKMNFRPIKGSPWR
jgi:two-component system, OmpR family, response regulator